jgi:hypothetical protein
VGELWMIGIRDVPVERGVLSLEQRQQTTSHKSLSIYRWSEMMGRVATGRNITDVDDLAEGILFLKVNSQSKPNEPPDNCLHHRDW